MPSGNTVLPKVEFVTNAKLVYMASNPQTSPSQPPAMDSLETPNKLPDPSKKNVIHKVRNTHQRALDKRKVAIHIYSVNTPHSSSVVAIVLPA